MFCRKMLMVGHKLRLVLKQRIRKHLLNASRLRHGSDDEDTINFVADIDAVCVHFTPHFLL